MTQFAAKMEFSRRRLDAEKKQQKMRPDWLSGNELSEALTTRAVRHHHPETM